MKKILRDEMLEKIEKSLKGVLDESQYEQADILFYDELARGRVLGRLYKLFKKELAQLEAKAVEQERKNNTREMEKFVGLVLHKLGGKITFTQTDLDTLNLDFQKTANHDGSITFEALQKKDK